MLTITATFSGFSVNDLAAAKQFYGGQLDCTISDEVGGCKVTFPSGSYVWMYETPNHHPAAYTMLNLQVDTIDDAVSALKERGIEFLHYPDSYQDAAGIMRGRKYNRGPNIAWFCDPAGNIIAVLEAA
jgi:predicted enzyme related to lactoylglutathione lyase